MEYKDFGKVGNIQVNSTSDGKIRVSKSYDKKLDMTVDECAAICIKILKAIAFITQENSRSMQNLPDALKEVKKAQKESGVVLNRFAKLLDD